MPQQPLNLQYHSVLFLDDTSLCCVCVLALHPQEIHMRYPFLHWRLPLVCLVSSQKW